MPAHLGQLLRRVGHMTAELETPRGLCVLHQRRLERSCHNRIASATLSRVVVQVATWSAPRERRTSGARWGLLVIGQGKALLRGFLLRAACLC